MDRAANQEICDSYEVNQMLPRQNMSFEQRDRENGNIRDVIPSKWCILTWFLWLCCGAYFLASWNLIASCLFLRPVSLDPVGPLYPFLKLPLAYVTQRCSCCMQPKNLGRYNSTNALWVLTFGPVYQMLIETVHAYLTPGENISHGGIWCRGLTQEQWHCPRLPPHSYTYLFSLLVFSHVGMFSSFFIS